MENQREKVVLKHERFPHGIIFHSDNLSNGTISGLIDVMHKVLDFSVMYTAKDQEIIVQFIPNPNELDYTDELSLARSRNSLYLSFVFAVEQTVIEIGFTLELMESKTEGRILC